VDILHGLLTALVDSSFACLALLEDETCQLFELLMKKTDDTQTNLLLDVILQETRKHRELFRHLSTIFENGPVATPLECGKTLGEFFTTTMALINSAREMTLRGMPMVEVVRKLISLEEGASEEYLTEMHANVRLLVERNQAARKILENIADDEREHVEILKLVIEIASKR
jgi:Mg2+ and Co2+ transporter CorA